MENQLAGRAASFNPFRDALEANTALLALDPIDLAGLHFQLATLHHRAGRADEAKRHVLLALDEAPRYRAAHELLLKLVEEK